MVTVENLFQRVSKVDLNYLIPLSLIDSREEYVRIQQEQLGRGERDDGKPIFNVKTKSTTYSPSYAKKKGKLFPIDLHDTGDFYGRIFVAVDDAIEIRVDSADWKSGMLQDDYSVHILTLNDKSKVEFVPIARQNLLIEVQKKIG